MRTTSQLDAEIEDEIQFHLEMRMLEDIRQGMPEDAARAAALAAFGDLKKIRNACRWAKLGDALMLARVQTLLTIVLLAAVVALAVGMYNAQMSNQRALGAVAQSLDRLAESATRGPMLGAAAADAPAGPKVTATVPVSGATSVDPATSEIRVTFDRAMQDKSWSWVQISKETFPEVDKTRQAHYLEDQKTCVLPVKLAPGKKYTVWINSNRYQNFKSVDGTPAVPYELTFETRK